MMLDANKYLEHIKLQGIEFFAGVPDSLLKDFCACVTENCPPENHIIAANEGGAVALAIGHYLGTNKVPLIYLQNSGLGNIINPLLSLASPQVYATPMLIMVGWRGAPGVKDEPQHVHQGAVMCDLIDAMSFPYFVLSKDRLEAEKQFTDALTTAVEKACPVFLIVHKNTFASFERMTNPLDYEMTREDAVKVISRRLPQSAAVVATTGMASRELFEYREACGDTHERDFLTVGGMGHANQIALGISKAQPTRYVCCVDGDGAVLMHMGSMALIGVSGATRYLHIVLNNGVHDSVGGQPTVGLDIDLCSVAFACGYKSAKSVSCSPNLIDAIEFASASQGPHFIEVRVKGGSRGDLGRPSSTPIENKKAMMQFLR